MGCSRLVLAGILAVAVGAGVGCRSRAGMLPEGLAVTASAESEYNPEVLLLKRMGELGLDGTQFRLRGNTFELYVVAAKSYDGELLARAYNSGGIEIGRVRVEVDMARHEARFVTFHFPGVTDMGTAARILIAPPGAE